MSPPQRRPRQLIDYHEWSGKVVLNQILADDWFLEARYQYTRSDLDQSLRFRVFWLRGRLVALAENLGYSPTLPQHFQSLIQGGDCAMMR